MGFHPKNTVRITGKPKNAGVHSTGYSLANAILYNSKLSFKWICPHCEGEYQHPLDRRSVGDDSCPYCANRKVLPGYNSFAARHPALLNEWSYRDNYLIDKDPDKMMENNTDLQ